jgi:hypothetical protein
MENLNHKTALFLIKKANKSLSDYKKAIDQEKKIQLHNELKSLRNRISYEIQLINKILEDEEND